jgi:hypothetical protein
MRGSQRIGDVIFGLALIGVFFAFGPFVASSSSKSRPRVRGLGPAADNDPTGRSSAIYAGLARRHEIR